VFAADAPGPERTTELVRMVRQDCGSCHGMRLTGGLGPALTPDALRGRPADGLAIIILYGRPGSAMPPWRQFVSEAEAGWMVEQLRQGFPDAR
jgi:cytochrome c55X